MNLIFRTIHSWIKKKTKVPVTYGRNSLNDLASSSDVEGVWCLEIPEICKPRFSSTSVLNVCRSNPFFVISFCRWENFVSYLISTQCWSLANQNKSFLSHQTSWLSFSLKWYCLIRWDLFLYKRCFLWAYYFKRASDWIQGLRYYWKAYLIIWTARSSYSQVHKNLLNGGELYEVHFLGIWKKYLGLVSFRAPLKGCFWILQKQGHRFYEVLYFLFLTSLVWRQNVQK